MRCNPAQYFPTSINVNRTSQTIFNKSSNHRLAVCLHRNHGLRSFHSLQDNQHSWSILKNIYEKQFKSAGKFACFLLNISDNSHNHFERYKYIWEQACLKVAVDGSANYLAKRRNIHTADVVCGDFDSIDAHLIRHLRCPTKATKLYAPKDCQAESLKMPQVVETPHQNETDFTKALRVAMTKRRDIHNFLGLYHSTGSRIDHLFGLINTLHIVKRNIILVNIKSNTVSWLLCPGNHIIQKPRGREMCSLVPFTGPTQVKTQGLEYNIGSSPLSFGGLISTSNICLEERENIIVETNRELLWSIDLSDRGSTSNAS